MPRVVIMSHANKGTLARPASVISLLVDYVKTEGCFAYTMPLTVHKGF